MRGGYEIVADGITVDARTGCPIILSDAADPAFFAAIFKEDNAAISEMRALDLERLRRFIIAGEGEIPMPPPRLTEPALIWSEPRLTDGGLERWAAAPLPVATKSASRAPALPHLARLFTYMNEPIPPGAINCEPVPVPGDGSIRATHIPTTVSNDPGNGTSDRAAHYAGSWEIPSHSTKLSRSSISATSCVPSQRSIKGSQKPLTPAGGLHKLINSPAAVSR
jgi:hypothetical protein